jgi:hypothetical protein
MKRLITTLTFAAILWSQPTFAAPTCAAIFAQTPEAQTSLLSWDAQQGLRRDLPKFTDLDLLGYTYSSDKDTLSYKAASADIYGKMSTQEKSALSDYTSLSGRDYEKMNLNISKYLNREELKKKDTKAVENLLSAFDHGVVVPAGFLLFRGIDSAANLRFGKVGSVMKWDRLTSTSVNPETARYFANNDNFERTRILVIEVAEPIKAILSKDPTEMEFILPPRTRFEVVSKHLDRSENIQIIHMKAYPPIFQD